MTSERRIRPATVDDGAACAAIYAPYVLETAISFETEPPSAADLAERIAKSLEHYAWLVLEEGDRVVGYAYGTEHRTRAAYRWGVDVSIYLETGLRRTGAGRALYAELLPILRDRGYRRALAGITQPNEASMAIHRAFGFTDVGTYRNIGWKHDRWHDVTWLQLDLVPDEDLAAEPAEVR